MSSSFPTYRVIRQVIAPADDETAAMGYQNAGPFLTVEDARRERMEMMVKQADAHLAGRRFTSLDPREMARYASRLYAALERGYEDDHIDVDVVRWTIREIPGK